MNRNLIIFFANAIPFGIVIGTVHTLLYDISVGMTSGVSAGMIFGFLMFIILGFLHSREVKKIAGVTSNETLQSRYVRTVDLQLSFERAFDLCIESLSVVNRCKIYGEDRSRGKIIAKSSVNWKTWGETISFKIDKIDNDSTHISVSSRPTSRTTLVDYGKNLDNVGQIISFFKSPQG